MCDFKPGDELVALNNGGTNPESPLPLLVPGQHYICARVWPQEGDAIKCPHCGSTAAVAVEGALHPEWAYCPCSFRKVQRRKTDLSIESFLTIKPGFEEPRRPKAPAEKERA